MACTELLYSLASEINKLRLQCLKCVCNGTVRCFTVWPVTNYITSMVCEMRYNNLFKAVVFLYVKIFLLLFYNRNWTEHLPAYSSFVVK